MNACEACGRDLEHGYLCPGDLLALAGRLGRLPKIYDALAGCLTPAARGGAERVSSGHAGAILPVNEIVLDLRAVEIVKTLEDWRDFMQADRGWGEPAVSGAIGRRIAVAARALSINLDWMAANWPPVGDLAGEIRDLERNALSIVDPQDPADRPRRLGYCPMRVDGVLCGAVVLLRPGRSLPRCDWCSTEWPSSRWLELARAQQEFEPKTLAYNPRVR